MLLTVLLLISFFTSIRFNTIAFTRTIGTTIMITVIISTISISVAVTITLPRFIVLIHTVMINTIVVIIVTLVSNCIMNVTVITASNNASLSIPAPVLLLSLLVLVRVPSSAQKLAFTIIIFMSTGAEQCTTFRFPPLQNPGLASAHVYIDIYIYSNPGTNGTRKYRSWRPDLQRSKDP